VLHYRTSASGLDQIRGSDLAALVVVAPLCVWIGTLARDGHPAAPLLSLAPAGFSVYIWTQLLFGSEFGRLPGNVEWFAPLLLGVVGVAVAVAVRATRALRTQPRLPWSRRMERATGVLMLVVAGFVVVGIHLSELTDAFPDHPVGVGLLTTPNAFWLDRIDGRRGRGDLVRRRPLPPAVPAGTRVDQPADRAFPSRPRVTATRISTAPT
jgi:hypothetical protein